MSEKKNIFISHVHEDDSLLSGLKGLIGRAGMEVSDSSIHAGKENNATNEQYIKNSILAPQIKWASTMVVLIGKDTAQSRWVNWEIEYAVGEGKRVVGVFAPGATNADIPKALSLLGDAAIVGWQGQRVVDAIKGDIQGVWDNPETEKPREQPEYKMERVVCQ